MSQQPMDADSGWIQLTPDRAGSAEDYYLRAEHVRAVYTEHFKDREYTVVDIGGGSYAVEESPAKVRGLVNRSVEV